MRKPNFVLYGWGLALDMIFAFPGWFLVLISARFLPKNHPWYSKWFGLKDWTICRTPIVYQFDLAWWAAIFLVFLITYF